MKRIFAIFAALCLVVILFMSGIILLKEYKPAYQEILNKLNIEPDLVNFDELEVHKLPLPHLTIKNFKQKDQLELRNLKINFSLISILKFNPKISSIEISSLNIHLKNNNFKFANHDKLVGQLISKENAGIKINVKELNLVDEYNNIIIGLNNFSLDQNKRFEGNVSKDGKFSGTIKEIGSQHQLTLNVSNNYYELNLAEVYEGINLLSGAVNYKIKNLPNLALSILPDISNIMTKISQQEIINIDCKIHPSEHALELKDIKILSNSIEGQGQAKISKNDKEVNLVELHFPKIDLNSLKGSTTNTYQIENNRVGSRFSFADKLLTVDISADQIKLTENEILGNVKFSSYLERGKLDIKKFTGQINSGGEFSLSGDVTQNAFRSIFDGKVYIKHNNINSVLSYLGYEDSQINNSKDFVLSSDLRCTLIDLYLQNLSLNAEDLKITGNISSKFIGSIPRIYAQLNFSSIDLNKTNYPIISPIVQFTKDLLSNMKDTLYPSKFIPVRTIPYMGNFDLTFNDLMVGSNKLGMVNLLANLTPGQIHIDNLYINTGQDYISTSITLSANGLKPELHIKINDGVLHTKFLSPRGLLALRNSLINEFSMDKISIKLDCVLSKLYQDNLEIGNVKFSGYNDNNLFNIDDLEGDILSGKLKAQGSILLEPHTWNFVYALNSIDLAKLSTILPKGVLNNSGGVSINGMLTTSGDNIEKMLYNLYMKSSLIMRDTKINNFSVDNLIESFAASNYDPQSLQALSRSSLLTGQTDVNSLTSDFKLSKGIINFDNMLFQTKYCSSSAVGTINIYNFNLELASIFSFYPLDRRSKDNTKPFSFNVRATGNLFDPQKVADFGNILQGVAKKP